MAGERFRIIQWNINKSVSRIDDICGEIIKLNPEVIVLTEVKNDKNFVDNNILPKIRSKWEDIVYDFSDSNYNGLLIITTDKNIKVSFDDCRFNKKCKSYPDMLLAKLSFSGAKIDVLGIRMNVSNMSRDDKKKQIESFINVIYKNMPDIIIGDFNWYSAIQTVDINKFNSYLNAEYKKPGPKPKSRLYTIWPPENYDYISFRHHSSVEGTTPDRVMWKNEKIKLAEVQNDHNENPYYVNFILKGEQLDRTKWPSDHDIIVVDFELDN